MAVEFQRLVMEIIRKRKIKIEKIAKCFEYESNRNSIAQRIEVRTNARKLFIMLEKSLLCCERNTPQQNQSFRTQSIRFLFVRRRNNVRIDCGSFYVFSGNENTSIEKLAESSERAFDAIWILDIC